MYILHALINFVFFIIWFELHSKLTHAQTLNKLSSDEKEWAKLKINATTEVVWKWKVKTSPENVCFFSVNKTNFKNMYCLFLSVDADTTELWKTCYQLVQYKVMLFQVIVDHLVNAGCGRLCYIIAFVLILWNRCFNWRDTIYFYEMCGCQLAIL